MEGDISAYLPLVLVIVGWAVVNHQNNRREDRKEARALVDRAKEIAVQVANEAIAYHCEGRVNLASSIKWALDALELELDRLPNFRVSDGPLMYCFNNLADAATGGDFESANFVPRSHQSPEAGAILRARNYMLAELERQFRAYYH